MEMFFKQFPYYSRICLIGEQMGYDFILEKAEDASLISFPCQYGEFEIKTGTFPWKILMGYLLANGAQINMHPDNLLWDIKEKGMIYVTGSEDNVYLDMHAEWASLLDLFVWLRKRDPNVVLADINEGLYYDPDSFRDFMKSLL